MPLRSLLGTPTTSSTRDLEWICATFMVSLAAVLAIPGDSLQAPQFAEFHEHHLTETFWACAFGAIGLGRIAALYINGRSPRTPIARIVGAALGLVSWSKLAIMLHVGAMAAYQAESLGVAIYGPLAVFEMISVYRAAYDARYVRR